MLKAQHKPDVIIVNVENMAHGKGVTPSTMKELEGLGIDVFTSGNHVFGKGEQSNQCFELYSNLLRPANYGDALPGHGFYRFAKNGQQFLILNLNGTVFFENQFHGEISNPFLMLNILLEREGQNNDIIFLDFHAEATSEKIAMGRFADARVAAIVGTHTHVPTADWQLLPGQSAYVTDVGMVGPKDSILGAKTENVLDSFLGKAKFSYEIADSSIVTVNAVLVTTDGAKAISIEKIYEEVGIL